MDAQQDTVPLLTKREKDVACLVREGLHDKEIALLLHISPHTVNSHLKKIHQKLHTGSRHHLVARLNKSPPTRE